MAGRVLGSLHAIGPWFSVVAGLLMALIGLTLLGLVPGWNLQEAGSQTWLRRLHLQSVANLLQDRSREGAFYVGLLTPFSLAGCCTRWF